MSEEEGTKSEVVVLIGIANGVRGGKSIDYSIRIDNEKYFRCMRASNVTHTASRIKWYWYCRSVRNSISPSPYSSL